MMVGLTVGVAVQWHVILTDTFTMNDAGSYGRYVVTTTFDGPVSAGAGLHRIVAEAATAEPEDYRACLEIAARFAYVDCAHNFGDGRPVDDGWTFVPA